MQRLVEIARNLPNKGKLHIFLGNPLSDGCDKTTVEPGNTFSPGIWTCGISIWIEMEGQYYTPDLLPDHDVKWGFEGEIGLPPVLETVWNAGNKITVSSKLTHIGCEGAEGVDFCRVEAAASSRAKGRLCIVIRDIGPAGGKIESIKWDSTKREIRVSNTIRLITENEPSDCSVAAPDERFDSPVAVMSFSFDLQAGEIINIGFKVEHGFDNRAFGNNFHLLHPFKGMSVNEGFEKSQSDWNGAFQAKVFAPDQRISKTWEREIFHILSAMECGLPRIGAVNYPVFWLRDGIIILRALDLIGRHDLARIGNDYLAATLFGGGFGAESDAPGEGLWTLVSHAKITNDYKWLESIFPYLEKRVEYIEKMLGAVKPIRMLAENRIPFYMNTPGVNILCLPSENGTIHGRMDWHSPDFFINCWTEGGLMLAAEAALHLNKKDISNKWQGMADKLSMAIEQNLLPHFGNDRDPIITPYPSGALQNAREKLAAKFLGWYEKNRLTPEGERNPEPLWTYFEAAQIHNAILLGFREMAWINLNGMLEADENWDVSAFIEGEPGGNESIPFKNGEVGRGWLDKKRALGGNMPHNWTSAEMINLIRSIFVVEEGDTIILCKGVPDNWLEPGNRFGVENMPTDFGNVSFSVMVEAARKLLVKYKGPERYRFELSKDCIMQIEEE